MCLILLFYECLPCIHRRASKHFEYVSPRSERPDMERFQPIQITSFVPLLGGSFLGKIMHSFPLKLLIIANNQRFQEWKLRWSFVYMFFGGKVIKVPKQRKALALKVGQLPPPKREAGSSPNKTIAFRGNWRLLLVLGSVKLVWGFVRSCSKMISSTKPSGCSHAPNNTFTSTIYSHKSTCLPTNMPNYMNRMNIPSFKIWVALLSRDVAHSLVSWMIFPPHLKNICAVQNKCVFPNFPLVE